MKRSKIIIAALFFSLAFAQIALSANIEKIKEIDCENPEVFNKKDAISSSFVLASKKKTKYVYSIDAIKILRAQKIGLTPEELKDIAVVFVNGKGETSVLGGGELDPKNKSSVPLITFRPVKTKIGDKIVMDETEGEIDLEKLGAKLDHFIRRRKVFLGVKKLSPALFKSLTENGTLIIPEDRTPARYLKDVKKIIIYKFANFAK